MSNHEFILRSGAVLKITTAPFEIGIALAEAVKDASRGSDPNADIADTVVFNANVRRALYPVFDTVLYENVRVGTALFDDPKYAERVKGDYIEICSRTIEVNVKPFFLRTSSPSIPPPETTSGSPASQ